MEREPAWVQGRMEADFPVSQLALIINAVTIGQGGVLYFQSKLLGVKGRLNF